jgi:SPP1 gp7 family putative phage head morphogenesis protein
VLGFAKQLFDHKLNAGKWYQNKHLKKIHKTIFDTLFSGAEEGYGKKLIDVEYGTPDYQMLAYMRKNLSVFSGFKTYQELRTVSDLLINPVTGKQREFNEFRLLVKQMDATYNVTYLQAEYNHAVASAQMAARWQDIAEDADGYDLRYDGVMDDLIRPAHAKLNGVIRPIHDPFWKIYYPPNDWNCRCSVTKVEKGSVEVTEIDLPNLPELKPMFANNVGIDGTVFPEKHPYYHVSAGTAGQIKKAVSAWLPKPRKN